MPNYDATAEYFEKLAARTKKRDPKRKARLLAYAAKCRARAAAERKPTPEVADRVSESASPTRG